MSLSLVHCCCFLYSFQFTHTTSLLGSSILAAAHLHSHGLEPRRRMLLPTTRPDDEKSDGNDDDDDVAGCRHCHRRVHADVSAHLWKQQQQLFYACIE